MTPSQPCVQNLVHVIKMTKRALVLFKGTGSIDKSLEAAGWQVDSLDIRKKAGATWTCDILDWQEWEQMTPGSYAFIWASPPCQQYSVARTTAKTPRNLELADRIVTKTLQIINFLKPMAWLMENPATGLLKTRSMVQDLPFRDVCYCRYSDGERHRYRKPTRLWGFLPGFVARPMCTRKDPCPFVKDNKHPCCAQTIDRRRHITFTVNELYSMPPQLCDDIAAAATHHVQAVENRKSRSGSTQSP